MTKSESTKCADFQSSDLVKQARAIDPLCATQCCMNSHLYGEMAHRIEELEAENARLREALGWASVVVDSVKDCEEVDPNTLAAAIIKMDVLQEDENPRSTKEPFSEYGHYGENNPPVGMSSPSDKDYEV